MSFESTIRDFMLHISGYMLKLDHTFLREGDQETRDKIMTHRIALAKLASECSYLIGTQIKFEKQMRERNIKINYPD